jgi:hypothetical protein
VAGYPAKAGIQLINKFPTQVGQHHGFVRFAAYCYYWIPAFAGMTA